MTAHFDPRSTEIIPEYHETLTPAAASELMKQFYRKVPSGNMSGIARLDRIEQVLSCVLTAQVEQSKMLIELTAAVDANEGVLKAVMSEIAERSHATAAALEMLGTVVFGPRDAGEIVPDNSAPIMYNGVQMILTFPGGDDCIVNEQGLYGFKLPARSSVDVEVMVEYLDDLCIALFEQGLISDELSDVFLNITSGFRSGEPVPTPDQVERIADAAFWDAGMESSLRMWFENDVEGFFLTDSISDPNAEKVLLNALWRIFFNTTQDVMAERILLGMLGLK